MILKRAAGQIRAADRQRRANRAVTRSPGAGPLSRLEPCGGDSTARGFHSAVVRRIGLVLQQD